MRVLRSVLFAMRHRTTVLSVLIALTLAAPAMAVPPVFTGSLAVPSGGTVSIPATTSACGLGTDTAGTLTKNFACFNVKLYGAKGDGTTDDTAAINSAITAAGATCGVAFLPPGTYYLGSGPVVPVSCVWISGSGVGATTLKLNGALAGGNADGIRFSIANGGTYLTDVRISDLAIDATAQTAGNGLTLQGWSGLRVEHVRVLNPFGFGFVVGSNGGATPAQYSSDLYMNDIYVTGERNGNDSIGGGSILRGTIQNYTAINAAGTCSDLTNITNFTYRGVFCYRSGTPVSGADGFDIDFGGTNVLYDGVFVDGAMQGMAIDSAATHSADTNIQIKNFTFLDIQKTVIFFNSASGLGPSGVDIGDGYIASWNQSNTAAQGVIFAGGSNIQLHDVTFAAPTNAAYGIRLNNDGGAANPPSNVLIHDNNLLGPSPNMIQFTAVGSNIRINKNIGFNPIGASIQGGQPAVPASGTAATNTYFADCTVYVQANGATMTTATQVGGNALNGFTTGSFVVPVGSNIKVFYSAGLPAWEWICN